MRMILRNFLSRTRGSLLPVGRSMAQGRSGSPRQADQWTAALRSCNRTATPCRLAAGRALPGKPAARPFSSACVGGGEHRLHAGRRPRPHQCRRRRPACRRACAPRHRRRPARPCRRRWHAGDSPPPPASRRRPKARRAPEEMRPLPRPETDCSRPSRRTRADEAAILCSHPRRRLRDSRSARSGRRRPGHIPCGEATQMSAAFSSRLVSSAMALHGAAEMTCMRRGSFSP